jgi:hypothetical protein
VRSAPRLAVFALLAAGGAGLYACGHGGAAASSGAQHPHDGGSHPPPVPFDADPTPPGVLAGVTPDHAYLARQREILVRGYSTRWTDATKVDLGPGVTVTNLSAALPDLMSVDFGVDPAAEVGPRDVTVVDADAGTLVDHGALNVLPPVTLTFDGTLAQGSIAIAHVRLVDLSILLDLTEVTDRFGRSKLADLAPLLPEGLSGAVLSATSFETDVELFIDEPVTGPLSFDLLSGPPGSATDVHYPAPGAIDVAARSPIALQAGTLVTGAVASKYATDLYEYAPPTAAPTILDFAATSLSGGGDAAMLLLPASGRWSDQLTGGAVATWASTSTDPIFAVFFDDSGNTGSYAAGVTATTPAATAATTPADATMAGAVVAPALPFVLTGGLLASSSSADWVRVATGPSDGGKKLHVQSAGDPHTFLDVTVYDADGTTSIGGNETGGPVDALAGPVAASRTYFVVFTPGGLFDPAHGSYVGILRLE